MSDNPDKMIPKPPPMQPLSPELAPHDAVVEPPPPKPKVDNTEVKAALAFIDVGAPLQDGTPDDPSAELAKIRKGE